MLQRLREKRQDEGGFTLIELLVVVLIIAILAAIAIPVFLRQREKAYVADLESTLRNAATAAESYAAQNDPVGSYEGMDQAALETEGLRVPTSQADFDVHVAADFQSYCVDATDDRITSGDWDGGGHFDSSDAGEGKPVTGTC
jgi:type IV pilus assembly protein PilA